MKVNSPPEEFHAPAIVCVKSVPSRPRPFRQRQRVGHRQPSRGGHRVCLRSLVDHKVVEAQPGHIRRRGSTELYGPVVARKACGNVHVPADVQHARGSQEICKSRPRRTHVPAHAQHMPARHKVRVQRTRRSTDVPTHCLGACDIREQQSARAHRQVIAHAERNARAVACRAPRALVQIVESAGGENGAVPVKATVPLLAVYVVTSQLEPTLNVPAGADKVAKGVPLVPR